MKNGPQVIIPGTYNITLQGKKDFAGMIKLRISRWVEYPGLSGYTLNVITNITVRERGRGRSGTEEKVT